MKRTSENRLIAAALDQDMAGVHAHIVERVQRAVLTTDHEVTCAIMCQAGKGYSLWLCKSHEQEHPDVTANCDD